MRATRGFSLPDVFSTCAGVILAVVLIAFITGASIILAMLLVGAWLAGAA